jgi:hypothetical protein
MRLRRLLCRLFGHKPPFNAQLIAPFLVGNCPRCFVCLKRESTRGEWTEVDPA